MKTTLTSSGSYDLSEIPSATARSAVIFSGSANDALANAICDYLGEEMGKSEVKSFSDGETWVKINENVRGAEVFVVQSTCTPVNDHLMQLLLMVDALRRASARQICAVIPYFGYARQDRKDQGRVALSAKLVANMIVTAGVDRVMTIDLHTGQIQGFFDTPVDNLNAHPIINEYIRENYDMAETVSVAADVGTVKRARANAETLGLPLAFIDKRRPSPNVAEVMNIVGEVDGKNCIIFDDMIDTAGTLCNAAHAIKERGAKRIIAACTHPVLSGPAVERLREAPIEKIIIADTIDTAKIDLPKLEVVSVAPLLGEAIARVRSRRSVSSLFT
jgi:ribose-phosphate pyrophosphokinase